MSDQRRRSAFSQLHPIWRGIGFILLVLIPFIAFGFAGMIMEYVVDNYPGLAQSPSQIVIGVDDLYVQLGLTLILTMLLYLVLSIFGSVLYSLSGARDREELVSRIGSGKRKY
jgi:hypothetical protein